MINLLKSEYINLLLDEMGKHPRVSNTNADELFDRVKDIVLCNPDNFAEDLKELYIKTGDGQVDNKFSLGMLLRHANIDNYLVSKSQHKKDKKGMKKGIFPYHSIIGDLTFNSDIVNMMKNSPVPYSLLGKIEKEEFSSAEKYLYKQKTPILIVVGADYNKITSWENKNTVHISEPDTLFKKTRVYINNPCFNF